MKKDSNAIQILKFVGMCLAGWLLWLLIFSATLPSNEEGATSEPFPGAIGILGVATAVIVSLVTNYNSMQKAYQKTKSTFSNINVFKDRTERLLEKANKVADKYMVHEESIQVGVADKRSRRPKIIRNSQQFQLELENYPDLKANQSIMELLSQIRESENSYAQSKLNYNAAAEHYNSLIHIFPNNIFRILFKFNDVDFYNDADEHEITDEELGI